LNPTGFLFSSFLVMSSFEATCNEEIKKKEWQYLPEDFDWQDVIPIRQDDGPAPVVAIAYTDECECLLNYPAC
jgi:hypothetical protein